MNNVSSIGVDVQPQKSSVIKRTVVAGAIGAGVTAATNVGIQYALKKSSTFMKTAEENISRTKDMFSGSKSIFAKYMNWASGVYEGMINAVKNGKFDYKALGKTAGVGAAIWAGTYLVYRGVKALFTSNN